MPWPDAEGENIGNNQNMNTKMKENYVAPETVSVELVSESLICNSEITGIESDRIDYGDPGDEIIWN